MTKPTTVGRLHSDPVYVVGRFNEDTYLALMEQFYKMLAGPDDIARSLASDLRKESPRREFLNMLALMLDPKVNCYFKLVIQRRRDGKTWTTRVNDGALAKATHKHWQALGGKRGQLKLAVGKVAEHFGCSAGAVRLALRKSK
jgi:hypothetical protein